MTLEEFIDKSGAYLEGVSKEPPADWSKEARDWAESQGIIKGDEYGNKMYKKPVTREEMAVILYNLHQKGLI